MPVTITDISRRLGLSVSTVSKALNNYPDVAPETRLRVQQAAVEFGYHPSFAARRLRSGRTGQIGLLFNDSVTYVADYLAAVIPSLILVAERSNYNLVLYTTRSSQPDTLMRICRGKEVDGLILFLSDQLDTVIGLLLAEQFPFIVMHRRIDDPSVSFIAPDNFTGTRSAIEHLIEREHRRIGFMTREALGTTNTDRLAGYKAALHAANISFNEELIVPTRIEPQSGYKAMQQLLALDVPPTAVFAFHDMVAFDALHAVRDAGLRVPEDVALVGADGLQTSLTTSPPITTIQPPLDLIGQHTTEGLIQLIEDEHSPPIRETLPVELVIRASTQQVDGSR